MRVLIAMTITMALVQSAGGRLAEWGQQGHGAIRATVRVAGLDTPTLARGRTVFVARCASCHGERGDKPLPTGLPLAARNLEANATLKMVGGRLKDSPVSDQEAVVQYILTLSKQR